MTQSLWPLCRLTLIITTMWLIMAFMALLDECHGTPHHSCVAPITHHEALHGIPTGLLHAISKVESGRKDPMGQVVSWPWTVNANGQGFYFPSKEAAILAVMQMQKKGIKSIDVGCMQVNLYHHPHAFKSLDEAFDPHKNVAYAAQFLRALNREHRSWQKAMAHYHSANPYHNIPYQKHVMAAWKREGAQPGVVLAEASVPNERLKRLHRLAGTSSSPKIRRVALATQTASSTSMPTQRVTRGARLIRF